MIENTVCTVKKILRLCNVKPVCVGGGGGISKYLVPVMLHHHIFFSLQCRTVRIIVSLFQIIIHVFSYFNLFFSFLHFLHNFSINYFTDPLALPCEHQEVPGAQFKHHYPSAQCNFGLDV